MIAPRPLMIEAGTKDDSVNIDHAREEFKRVESVYGRLDADHTPMGDHGPALDLLRRVFPGP